MIVELFGPPGAGKTTFAGTIAKGLQARGCPARTVTSSRRSEAAGASGSGPEGGLPAPGRAFSQNERAEALAAVNRSLMQLLPPKNLLWRLRLRRYLGGLARSWARSEAEGEIVVFDQGYTHALCSLISLSDVANPVRIAAAAALLPDPVIRICVEVPRALLLARQRQRLETLGVLERIRELDPATSLAQAEICDRLRETLTGRAPLLSPDPMNPADLDPLLATIAGAAAARRWSLDPVPMAAPRQPAQQAGRQ